MSAAGSSYVALGDSYASGEGVEPFLPGTNRAQPENRCHRSTLAYSRLLGDAAGVPARRTSWACSGARIGNFFPGQGQWGEAGQLEHLDADTRLVTLSVGGNDLQFAAVLGSCFTLRSCQTRLAPFANLLLDHTEGSAARPLPRGARPRAARPGAGRRLSRASWRRCRHRCAG